MSGATLVFLKRIGPHGPEICLARKKQHIHTTEKSLGAGGGKYNGYGGKINEGKESIREAAVRELKDESGVTAGEWNLEAVGLIDFFWPGNTGKDPDMRVYVFTLDEWEGDPKETEEMEAPQFFVHDKVPYKEMMPADGLFLPAIFAGRKILGEVHFRKRRGINHHEEIDPVSTLTDGTEALKNI